MNTIAHGRGAARARQAREKPAPSPVSGAKLLVQIGLENQLPRLELLGVKRRTDNTKVAGSYVVANAAVVGVTLELRMVQGLKLSARNSKRLPRDSLMAKPLNSDRFQSSRPGPRMALKPRFP